MKPIKLKELLTEQKIKTDAKSYKELARAIDRARTTEDIWNQLDPKLFPFEFDEFEEIFDEWWDRNSYYDSIADFARNATKADVEDLLSYMVAQKR